MNIKNCPDCLNTQALRTYDPLLQEFVWFEDDSIVDSIGGFETTNVIPKVLLRRKIMNKIQEVQKTILRLR